MRPLLSIALLALPVYGANPLRVAGQPLRHPTERITLHVSRQVHLAEGEAGVDRRETVESVHAMALEAARTWGRVDVEFTDEGKVNESALNLVTFTDREPFDAGLCDAKSHLACTLVYHNPETRQILMVKIAFNPYKRHSSLGFEGTHDLGSVLLHEMGHALGLDHSGSLDSIMSPVVELAGQPAGFVRRVLAPDDVHVFGGHGQALEGRVMRDGVPVIKANLLAMNTEGRIVGSVVTDRDGSYRLPLPPGEYRLAAEPLDGPVFAGQIWGEQEASEPFSTVWWTRGGGALDAADPVVLKEGESQTGLEFAVGHGAPVNAQTIGTINGGSYLGYPRVMLARGRDHYLGHTRMPAEGVPAIAFSPETVDKTSLATVPASAPQLVRQRIHIKADAALGPVTMAVTYESGLALLPAAIEIVCSPLVHSLEWLEPGRLLIRGEDLAPAEVQTHSLPTQLGGVSVRIGERFAEIESAGPREIVVRWPEAGEVTVKVVTGAGVESEAVALPLQ